MLVHLLGRSVPGLPHLPHSWVRELAPGLRAQGVDVVEDLISTPCHEVAATTEAWSRRLAHRWEQERPDVVHAVGVVATMAAVRAARRASAGPGPVILSMLDEDGVPRAARARLARQVTAVLPLSRVEDAQWAADGIPTLWSGSFPFHVPVVDPDAGPTPGGHVVTFGSGAELERVLASTAHWSGDLVIAGRLSSQEQDRVRHAARDLGVGHRLVMRPGVRGRDRRDVWTHASAVVAGASDARHGAAVLAAAAHAVPAVASAEGAHTDHIVSQTTGLLVDPQAAPRTWGRAIAFLVDDPFTLRALGTAALSRVGAVNTRDLAGRRLMSLYLRGIDGAPPGPQRRPEAGARRGREQRDELALQHLPLATSLAGRYVGRGQAREDLVQVAALGLVRAAERFDASVGTDFHAFAVPSVLGELRKHFRDHAWAVRVPRGLQESMLDVQRASDALAQTLGCDVSTRDLADHLERSEDEVRRAQRVEVEARWCHPLDQPVGDGRHVAELIGALEPALDLAEQRRDVWRLLEKLPEREQRILLMRFFADRTQSEIADRLGISQVQVSRILAATLATLREHVLNDAPLPAAWGLLPPP